MLYGTAARHLTTRSSDISLFDKFLEIYHLSLCAPSLPSFPSSFRLLTTSMHLADPSSPTLLDWLTNRSHMRAFGITHHSEPVALAFPRTTSGNKLTVLALPTPTAADAAIVAVHGAPVCRAPTPVWAYMAYGARTRPKIPLVRREMRTPATMLMGAQ